MGCFNFVWLRLCLALNKWKVEAFCYIVRKTSGISPDATNLSVRQERTVAEAYNVTLNEVKGLLSLLKNEILPSPKAVGFFLAIGVANEI
jgi:hypothetical protein